MIKILIGSILILNILIADKINGWNILHNAVFENDYNITKNILNLKEIDIDAKSKAGISPLHIAVKNRNLKLVKLLLRNKADIDIQDNNGLTPLHYATGQKRYKIVKYLILHGADIDIKNRYGITPLHQAAFSGDLKTVEFLIQAGADIWTKNNLGATPYDLAKAKKREQIANYILNYMEDKNESKSQR